jgi:hypothetical protein
MTAPKTLRARVVSYALAAYKVFIESGPILLQIERASAILIVKHTSHAHHFPKHIQSKS